MENTEEKLLTTPLAAAHVRLNARMVPFAGWLMPVQYAGILAEHEHTRRVASLFDICHMGEFEVRGAASAAALDAALARGVTDQKIGVCRYNFLLDSAGGVLDDLIVYRMAEDEFFIVVNAGCRNRDWAVLSERLSGKATIRDLSDATAKLDLQGPRAAAVLARFGVATEDLPGYYQWRRVTIAKTPVLLSRTGYTGELGFELYFAATEAERLWTLLLEDPELKPAGLGARDTLRLESGYPLYGHELHEHVTPLEAGFGAMLKLNAVPERDFVGASALRTQPVRRKLVGLKLDGRRAARAETPVLVAGCEVGRVTSGAFAPSLGVAIALAYVDAAAAENTQFDLAAERVMLHATRVELPFYNGTAKIKR